MPSPSVAGNESPQGAVQPQEWRLRLDAGHTPCDTVYDVEPHAVESEAAAAAAQRLDQHVPFRHMTATNESVGPAPRSALPADWPHALADADAVQHWSRVRTQTMQLVRYLQQQQHELDDQQARLQAQELRLRQLADLLSELMLQARRQLG